MSTKTFKSAIRGYHYYKKYWSPHVEEKLTCSHEDNNAFDIFAIKTCKEDGTIVGHLPRELSRTLKFLLARGARISAVLTSTHYRRSPLVQGGLEIPCEVMIEMSPTQKNAQLLDRLMEIYETVYTEPLAPIILGSFIADEMEVDVLSKDVPKTVKSSQQQKKETQKKQGKSHDIREMFRNQKKSKKPRVEDEESDSLVVVID